MASGYLIRTTLSGESQSLPRFQPQLAPLLCSSQEKATPPPHASPIPTAWLHRTVSIRRFSAKTSPRAGRANRARKKDGQEVGSTYIHLFTVYKPQRLCALRVTPRCFFLLLRRGLPFVRISALGTWLALRYIHVYGAYRCVYNMSSSASVVQAASRGEQGRITRAWEDVKTHRRAYFLTAVASFGGMLFGFVAFSLSLSLSLLVPPPPPQPRVVSLLCVWASSVILMVAVGIPVSSAVFSP